MIYKQGFCKEILRIFLADEAFSQLVDDVDFEFFGRLEFFRKEEIFLLERFSLLLLGEKGEIAEFEQSELIDGGKGAQAGEVIEP